jgi:hypothetical protein
MANKEEAKEIDWDSVPVIEKGIGSLYKFEQPGETIIGEYLGMGMLDTDEGEKEYHRFKLAGDLVYAVSASFDLSRKLEEVEPGSMVRIEYLDDQPTKRGQTPMKVFKVQATF